VSVQAKLKPIYSLYKNLKQTLAEGAEGAVANADLMKTVGLDLDMTALMLVGSPRAVSGGVAETPPAEVLVVMAAAPPGHPDLSLSASALDVGVTDNRDTVLVVAAAAIDTNSRQAAIAGTPTTNQRRLLGPSNGRPRPGSEQMTKGPGKETPRGEKPADVPERPSFGFRSSGLTTMRVQLETGGAKPQHQPGDGGAAGGADES